MSPVIVPLRDRTALCAAGSEHGSAAVQAVPVPVGDAWRVVVSAEAGGAVAIAVVTTATAASAARRNDEDVDKGPPEVFGWINRSWRRKRAAAPSVHSGRYVEWSPGEQGGEPEWALLQRGSLLREKPACPAGG
ncbi:hypothetical protein ABZX92_35670 [Lentzea sp. NPDC006480]|uniref:hypothetical protein n=1 Tax=Lentzea sp. NPDC006480 TaxID=3157176 RepID=UPI0033B19806